MLVVLKAALVILSNLPARRANWEGGKESRVRGRGGKFRFMKNKMTGYIQLNETFSPQDHV